MRTGNGLIIKGDMTAAEDMTVDFILQGSLDLSGFKLMVTEGASVEARVRAKSVVVRGRVEGHVATERLEVSATGSVLGSVVSPKLLLHEGAVLQGPVNTERAQAAGTVAQHKRNAGAGSR